METKFPTWLNDETLRENERLLKLLTEEQRYKQNARLRALEVAQLEIARAGGDVITEAQTYYDWLMAIATDIARPSKEAS